MSGAQKMIKSKCTTCCTWCGIESNTSSSPEVTYPHDDKLTLCNSCLEIYYNVLVINALEFNISGIVNEVTAQNKRVCDAFKEIINLCCYLLNLENVQVEKSHSELAHKAMEVL